MTPSEAKALRSAPSQLIQMIRAPIYARPPSTGSSTH
jgi:hypothetical protein